MMIARLVEAPAFIALMLTDCCVSMSLTVALPQKADLGNELILRAALVVFCATIAAATVVSTGWGAQYFALSAAPSNIIMVLSSIGAAFVALRSGARLMGLG